MNQITFKQYRTMDVIILVALTIIFEGITTAATNKWFALQPIAMSIGLAMVCVTMMRWGWQAAFTAFASGFVFCVISGATGEQYLIYCIGNLCALVALFWVKRFGKDGIRGSVPKLLVFGTTAYFGMALGRWLVSLVFGGDIMALLVYATTDIMTLAFAILVLLLFRKADGMLEDQKAYLFRLERERKAAEDEPVMEEEEY